MRSSVFKAHKRLQRGTAFASSGGEEEKNMQKALQPLKGKTIRLYTVSGVESYLGTVHDLDEQCVTLKDAIHGELMYIALQHVESFHEAKISR